MDRTALPTVTESKPFVRARRVELEPVVFAASMIAMVMAVGLWLPPSSKSDQPVFTGQATQVAAKPTP